MEDDNTVKIRVAAETDEASIKQAEQRAEELHEATKPPDRSTSTPAANAEAKAQEEVGKALQGQAAAANAATAATNKLTPAQKQAEKAAKDAAKAAKQVQQELMAADGRAAAAAGASGALASAVQQASSAAQGSVPNFTAAAAGITQMALAIKAGMGPVGWMMLALQALQTGLQYFMDKEAEATASSIKNLEEHNAAVQRLNEQYRQLMRDDRKGALEEAANATKEAFDKAADKAAQAREASATALQREEQMAQLAARRLEAEAANEQQRVADELAAGKIGMAEAERRRIAIANELKQRLAAIEEESRKRREAEARDAVAIERQRLATMTAALEEYQGKWQPLLGVDLPSEADFARVKAQLATMELDDPARAAVEKEQEEMLHTATTLRKTLRMMGISVDGSLEEIVAYGRSLKEQVKLAQEQVKAQERKVQQTEEAAEFAARANDEERKIAAMQASVMERINTRAIIEEQLRGIGEAYKTSRTYAEKDKRALHEIYEADGEALHRRKAHLEALLSTPGMDADTQRNINAQLKATEAEIRGLRQAWGQSRAEARKQLEAMRMPIPKGKNKQAQTALERLRKAFDRQAAEAEKAASMGNTPRLARIKESMKRTALAMERLSGYSGIANAHMVETARNLDMVERASGGSKRYVSRQKERQMQIEASLGRRKKAEDDATRAVRASVPRRRQQSKAQQEAAQMRAQLATSTSELARLQQSVEGMGNASSSMAQQATALANAAAAKFANQQQQLDSLKAAVGRLRRS